MLPTFPPDVHPTNNNGRPYYGHRWFIIGFA